MFDAEIVSAIIEGLFGLASTLLSAFIAYMAFTRLMKDRSERKRKLELLKEVEFFQALERVALKELDISQQKLRKMVKEETGLTTSSKFPPSRVTKMIDVIEDKLNEPTFAE